MNQHRPISPLVEAFGAVSHWLEHGPDASVIPPRTAADDVAEAFDLDLFGRNILLLCAYLALEAEGQSQLEALTGQGPTYGPSVGVALTRLPGANWSALAPDQGLRRAQLVTLEGAGGMTGNVIRLSEPVLFCLLGSAVISEESAGVLSPLTAPRTLAPHRAEFSAQIAARLNLPGAGILHLNGPDEIGKLQSFVKAAGRAYGLNSLALPNAAADIRALSGTLWRDMKLTGAALVLIHLATAEDRSALLFSESYDGPLAIASPAPLQAGSKRALRLEMPQMTPAQQRPVWEAALEDMATPLEASLPRILAAFQPDPETIHAIATEVRGTLGADIKHESAALASATWAACRRATRPNLDDLAQRISSKVDWDALVLPKRQKEALRQIVMHMRHQMQVMSDWGFDTGLQSKGIGLSAVFSGPSGTGKSMAAEVIGTALDLDVYRIDLSSITSKYIGETEKNLRRVFDAAEQGGSVLLFDEADALFGTRSDIKDSHDRHANGQVSYLLQRIEAFRGLSILTTNLRDNIDDAFTRRFRFIVDFPFPNAAERSGIWQSLMPAEMPREGVDTALLAQLNVPGGVIRNIALSAAFLAADQGTAVGMGHLYTAARQEYDKIGRSMTDAEVRGWSR